MKIRASISTFLALVGLVAANVGCHSTRRGEPITGPMNLNAKEQRGRVVFQMRCNQCHPNGEAGLGPALNNKPAPAFLMKAQVRLGLGAMPRFNSHAIPPSELDDLMAYVLALRRADKSVETGKPEKPKNADNTKKSQTILAPRPTK